MDEKTKKRLEIIEEELDFFERTITRLKGERNDILHKQFKNGTKILDQVPAVVKNQLSRAGVKNDCDLIHFVEGDFECDKTWGNFDFKAYENATTGEARLMAARGIGKISAKRTLELLKENGF